jgi:type III pantothenate kinase
MGTHLVLDIGNSRTKLGLFMEGRLARHGAVKNGDVRAVRDLVGREGVDHIVVGSVAGEDDALMSALKGMAEVVVVTGDAPSPIRTNYVTPATLGADRLANAVAASIIFPQRPILAIALGTCVTYDLVVNGTYEGGIISPGLQLRARAMHEFTAQLPQVDPPDDPALVGRTTAECMGSGAHHGLRGELVALIREFRQQHPGLAVVLTGGDAPRFVRALENGIFAHPFLTLLGLNELLLHHLSHSGAPAAG